MARIRPRARVPRTAGPGEVITVKTLISHPMRAGRPGNESTDTPEPRRIITRFEASFDGETAVCADLGPAVSANPYVEFQMRVPQSGTLRFAWHEESGEVHELTRHIEVIGQKLRSRQPGTV